MWYVGIKGERCFKKQEWSAILNGNDKSTKNKGWDLAIVFNSLDDWQPW